MRHMVSFGYVDSIHRLIVCHGRHAKPNQYACATYVPCLISPGTTCYSIISSSQPLFVSSPLPTLRIAIRGSILDRESSRYGRMARGISYHRLSQLQTAARAYCSISNQTINISSRRILEHRDDTRAFVGFSPTRGGYGGRPRR